MKPSLLQVVVAWTLRVFWPTEWSLRVLKHYPFRTTCEVCGKPLTNGQKRWCWETGVEDASEVCIP